MSQGALLSGSRSVPYGAFIVGCGPAGISIAYLLKQKGVPYVLVEREDCTVPLWRKYTYDCLKLQLPKEQCGLVGVPAPGAGYPEYLSNKDMVKYLDECIEEYEIEYQLNEKVTFAKFDESNQIWKIETELTKEPKTKKEYHAYSLVVATGLNSDARPSVLKGLNEFPASTHSKNYKNAEGFEEQTVLVIGRGLSGKDIAQDLKGKAKLVYTVVKDLKMPRIITDYHRAEGQVRERKIFAMPEITGSDGKRIFFANKRYIDTDHIIFATGYEVKIKDWLKGSKLRGRDGRPLSWKDANNKSYYLGFDPNGLGGIKLYAEDILDEVYSTWEE